MSEAQNKVRNQQQRRNRSRSTTRGTQERPRLSVKVSTTNVSAQIIDDESGTTLAAATSIGGKAKGTMIEKAASVGEAVAKAAKAKKVSKVVFDRGDKQYHGRVKALAESARKNGLEF